MKPGILVRHDDALLQVALDPLHGTVHILKAQSHTRMSRRARGIESL
jgi:hypothetical protein